MTTTTSDCGCSDTTAPLAPARTRTVTRASTGAAGASASTSAPASQGTVVLDGFHGLNPRDGLFLRAEHLALIQDYARSLATALATASGPGVVHGFGARLAGTSIEVSPGLAITPGGRLLRLPATVTIPLDDTSVPPRQSDGFWRVEVYWAQGTSGSAPVYGSLCNDTCADGGTTIEPFLDEGVSIRIVTDSLPGLDAVAYARRRNWLASAYFERERAGGQPWLVPTGVGNPVSMWSHDWDDATPMPQEAGVQLAVLQKGASAYELDVWAARRLVDGTAANATWRDRLAMRPWSVFLAQVLQFEAQLTGVTLDAPTTPPDDGAAAFYEEATKELLDETQRFLETVKATDPMRARGSFQRLAEFVHRTAEHPDPADAAPPGTMPPALEYGFGELPPAGYLAVFDAPDQTTADLKAFFGPNVDLHLRQVRADQVADEVLAAQHRDRIPLEPYAGRRPQVDILVPSVPADKAELATDAYGWVAFVRRGPDSFSQTAPPAPQTEDVEVYLLWADQPQRYLKEFTDADLKQAKENDLGTLTFPKGSWAYPGGAVATKVLETLGGVQPVGLVGLTAGTDRPLVATRAGLFGTSLDSGTVLPVLAKGGEPVEAIVVVAPIVIN